MQLECRAFPGRAETILCIVAIVLALFCTPRIFAQPPQLSLVGEAELIGGRIRLTPARRQMAGAAWMLQKQRISRGFEAEFRFQITEAGGLGNGADGFAFVLQNQGPDALAGRGAAGGFALGDGFGDRSKPGIPRSIAVFFDTFRNHDGQDPSNNYIAICTNGPIGKMQWPPGRLGVARKLRIQLKDGRPHKVLIRYEPPLMSVSLDDGEPEIRVPVDLSTVIDNDGRAYLGFTASTGSGYENHDILDWAFSAAGAQSSLFQVESSILYHKTSCLDGRNLCTPPEALVEDTGGGSYHVILPAHLEWSASVPTPAGRKSVLANLQGKVCWRGGDESTYNCTSPEESLLTKTENGRTWFSIRPQAGSDRRKYEGFFAFDVRVE